ncbi:N-acetylmuramoyl-L-alanine amidase [Kiritimatiellota bacterium B12222]|nr:N-acetylmuramoyl-L-alanine amidase [Kiritimatiellota bacterium B12222]
MDFFLVTRCALSNIRAMFELRPFFKFCLATLLVLLTLGSGRPPHATKDPSLVKLPKTVTVKQFAHDYGFTEIKVGNKEIVLVGAVHELKLFKDSRKAELNGSVIWLNDPVVVENRKWVLSQVDAQVSLRPIILPSAVLKGRGFNVVVLDAGHGGEDGGAVSPTGLLEKQVVLDITRRVRADLLAKGYQVFLTRHDDRFLELEERPRRAESWKADVFVSIHANSGGSTAVGTETFILTLPGYLSTNQSGGVAPQVAYAGNTFNQANMSLGFAIHHALTQQNKLTDRGVRHARFAVLKQAPCPAALVEVGFLSHAQEGAQLAQVQTRVRLSASIATGIDNYLRAAKKAAIEAETETED